MKDKQKEVKAVYEELRGILTSLEGSSSWFYDEGFSQHANHVIARIGEICPDITDIASYKIVPKHLTQGMTIDTLTAKARLSSLLGRIKGTYDFDQSPSGGGHTFIQNQSLNVQFLLDVRGQIEKHLPDYKTGEPEKKFLEKLKENLSTAQSTLEVLRLIFSTAKEFGVSIAALLKIFGI